MFNLLDSMLKKLHVLGFALLLSSSAFATRHVITTSGLQYSPDMVMAQVGDQVVFNVAFSSHPTVQVSEATWNANGATPMPGGFNQTSGTTFTITLVDTSTVYFVCRAHVGAGMKGMIMVSTPTATRSLVATQPAYPNPASLELTLPEGMGSGMARILTAAGQEVLSRTVESGQRSLPLAGLPPGCYVLLLNDRSLRFTKE